VHSSDEADLVILDELAIRGPRTLDQLREACDVDVTAILDGWDSLSRGPAGEARVERLLAALCLDRDGPESFAARLLRLVDRGLVARVPPRFAITDAGEAYRSAFD
jgi:hypothetical protein